MPTYPFRPGMQPGRQLRPALPAVFYAMSRDEIVTLLIDGGYSQKTAERDANGFEEHRSHLRGKHQAESGRIDSVSENGVWDRLIHTLRRRT